ncbi:late competence development ComFB family protein [Spirochaeta lutea]|uniref:late competence development ComFB family protein n=1 Tax=Spirochaeta lutea TaxID=1480694 RepID=UPI00056A3832|nr:late competence development ComFB family protein [Spirochaeta lutea]
MGLADYYNLEELHNHAEHLVFEEIERLIADNTISQEFQKEEYILDIAALALNRMPPMYRATLLGRIYEPALEEQHRRNVQKAVGEAVEKVCGT